jgi:hypothetical protein
MSQPKTAPPLVAPDLNKSVPPRATPPTTAPGITGFVSGKGASAEKPTGKSGK